MNALATLEIDGERVSYKNGAWRGASPALKARLDKVTDLDGHLPYNPDPARQFAEDIVERLGGKIIETLPPGYVEGRIY